MIIIRIGCLSTLKLYWWAKGIILDSKILQKLILKNKLNNHLKGKLKIINLNILWYKVFIDWIQNLISKMLCQNQRVSEKLKVLRLI